MTFVLRGQPSQSETNVMQIYIPKKFEKTGEEKNERSRSRNCRNL